MEHLVCARHCKEFGVYLFIDPHNKLKSEVLSPVLLFSFHAEGDWKVLRVRNLFKVMVLLPGAAASWGKLGIMVSPNTTNRNVLSHFGGPAV